MYQTWMKRGRDPFDARDFHNLSRAQAEQFLKKFVDAIPERMEELEALVRERRPAWRPDFSERAFVTLGDFFEESIESVPRTVAEMKADLEHQRHVQPEILALLGEAVRDWELSDRTLSLAYDSGIYLGQDLMSKEPRMNWQVGIIRDSNMHHPVLAAPRGGRRVPFIFGCPVNIFLTTASGVLAGDPPRGTMSTVYQAWTNKLQLYRGGGI
jgi:hypothetical protein